MTDFAPYVPGAASSARSGADVPVGIRQATALDAPGLAVVMAARGGTPADHLAGALRQIESLPVLRIAVRDAALVGWCGAGRVPLEQGSDPVWLIAGLTVRAQQRRQGIGHRLLLTVCQAVWETGDEEVFSVVNAANLASVDLHERAGFEVIARAASFAGITFSGGLGLLLRSSSTSAVPRRA